LEEKQQAPGYTIFNDFYTSSSAKTSVENLDSNLKLLGNIKFVLRFWQGEPK